jgi:VWFA-related protein
MRRFPIVLIAIGVAWAGAAAQQVAFRTGVEYVALDVVVTDKHDKPVKGLAQSDFEIVERGRAQTITNFQYLSIPAVRRHVDDVKTTAPSIDVVSNQHPPNGRQWVMVIDDLHIIELHLRQTKAVVQEFLELLPPEDQVAIVFVGRSDLSQDFTSDLGAQMRTVNRIKDSLGFAYDAADTPLVKGAGGDGEGNPERVSNADRHRYGEATITVLNNVARAVARSTYPRKAIVYVSEGATYSLESTFAKNYLDFNTEVNYARDFLQQMINAFDVAKHAGTPVYTIDPRGIPDCTAVRGDCVIPPWAKITAQQNNMRTLAENTGGRAFVGFSDMPRAVAELIEDNSDFYILGYYPDPLVHDGKFHGVDVKVKGHGDYRVRARAGYDAPKASAADAASAKVTLEDVLSSPLPVAGLELRASAAPVSAAAKGMKTAVTMEVTYPPGTTGRLNDTLQFGIIALDHDGKVKASTRRTYTYTATAKDGVPVTYLINTVIELPAAALTLRVGVSSQMLGKAASIHVPVEVVNPSRDTIQIGSVLLGFAGSQRQTAVPPGALKDLVPFQPTLARTFAASDTLKIFAPFFWGRAGGSALAVISVKSGDKVVMTQRADLSSDTAPVGVGPLTPLGVRSASPAQQNSTSFSAGLQLKTLAPGAYVLEVAGKLGAGQVKRDVSFEIK